MAGEHHPAFLEQGPEWLPRRVINFGTRCRDPQIGLAEAALGHQAPELLDRGIRIFGRHRHAQQAVGRRRVELSQPVVIAR